MLSRSSILPLMVFGLVNPTVRAEDVDYIRDIKPVLKAKCFSCHGALKQEAGLRVDTVKLLRKGGDSGAAIEDGSLEKSLLWQRVSSPDPNERMPPEGEPLSKEQLARLRAWLQGGATVPRDEQPQVDPKAHWAFQPLRPIEAPQAKSNTHPIDAFVEAKQAGSRIGRAPRADAITLIRRMFLDLHGLPPTPTQLDHWIQRLSGDDSGQAAEQLVDELLASPRYGERWAQHWLDVVRYADTHGYEVNTPRPNAWPYRDYVINAFNSDTPYDRFVTEQLLGDVENAPAATGFLVAAAALLPGQIGKDDASKRLARQDELDEIIVGTSATFLGLTVGCARCHDHKFDPIPQRDYYAFQAFFAGVKYGDREIRDATFAEKVAEADSLKPKLDDLRTQLAEFQPPASTARTIIIDDEDLERVTILAKKNGHGSNPAGKQRGYRDDTGTANRVGNLSRGRYTWWPNKPGQDVFTWNPSAAGRFRIWVSWGVHGSGVHARDARYVLDLDGDLATKDDQKQIATADQYYFVGVTEGETEKKPMWSGLLNAGVHQLTEKSRIVLRCGKTMTGITADVMVLQEAKNAGPNSAGEASSLPRIRKPVDFAHNIERIRPTDAKFVRFTSFATDDDNKYQPCIDELEVFSTDATRGNVALASHGTASTSSGNYSTTGKHQLQHINDGRHGNDFSWISNEHGKGWVQLEFAEVENINRIEWGRDKTGRFKDRLAIDYRIESSLDGTTWQLVAGSSDREPMGTPHDETNALLRNNSGASAESLRKLAGEIRQLEKRDKQLRTPQRIFAGVFGKPGDTFLLNRGDPEQPTDKVAPHVLTALIRTDIPASSPLKTGTGTLSSLPEQTVREQSPRASPRFQLGDNPTDIDRRRMLAEWITSPSNPLTTRVMVNRIWQYHFGMGLVETPSDFGLNGAKPSHPELLDWLAAEFINNDWSVKHLHRIIMSSQTYQQASSVDSGTAARSREIDGDNRLLWHFPSRRLEAEAIRDCILHISGQLNLETGGPGFDFFKSRGGLSGFPPVDEFGKKQMKRMIYAHKIRMEPVPIFGAFDCPDAGLPTPKRSQSTTAIQALSLFNSAFVIDQAKELAGRVKRERSNVAEVVKTFGRKPEDEPKLLTSSATNRAEADAIRYAFRLALGRHPSERELAAAVDVVRQHGLATLCRALFNSNEFLFLP